MLLSPLKREELGFNVSLMYLIFRKAYRVNQKGVELKRYRA